MYRETHDTFEDYCRDRWHWGRNYVNKMIGASDVADSLGTTVPTPTSERQARPLAKLPEAERGEAWGFDRLTDEHLNGILIWHWRRGRKSGLVAG